MTANAKKPATEPGEVFGYISDLAATFVDLTRANGSEFLAYLFAMIRDEAAALSQSAIAAGAGERKNTVRPLVR